MGRRDRYVGVLLALLIGGAPVFAQAEDPFPQWADFQTSFVDGAGSPLEPAGKIRNLVVDWGALGGTTWGMADQHLLVAHFESVQSLRVDFAKLATLVERHAKTISNKAREMSINVVPEDTRFAVVLPGLHPYPVTGNFSFNVNVLDVATNNRLVLMWFDRPCRLTGTMVGAAKSTNYDVEVEKSGFVWVEITGVDEKTTLAKRIEGDVEFKLVVTVR